MIIKYCSFCSGKPYTIEMSRDRCPVCGNRLSTELIADENTLDYRNRIVFERDSFDETIDDLLDEFSVENNFSGNDSDPFSLDDISGDEISLGHEVSPSISDIQVYQGDRGTNNGISASYNSDYIIGRVVNYSCAKEENDKSIKRSFVKKLFHFLIYRQKTDDVLHRFNLYSGEPDELGYSHSHSIPVNIYGGISDGMAISENDVLEIYGKYNNNNVFMGKEAYINNQGNRIKLHFRHSPKFIVDCICSLIVLALIIFTSVNYDASFVEGLGTFIKTWIIMAIVFLVLYFAVFKWIALIKIVTGKGGIPISGVLFSSFIATLLYMNRSLIWASTGSAIMGFLKPIIITIIFFAVIIFLLKMLIGL